ncbi:MAG: ArgE/DapE family deacylase [Candidatus Methylomirabilia bacterium]
MGDVAERVSEIVDKQREACLEFLQELVRHPSVLGHEASVQDVMARTFRQMGLHTEVFDPDLSVINSLPGFSPVEWSYQGRPCVVGVWRSPTRHGRSLILNGHVDVVSPEPLGLWTRDPWGGALEGDRLYGRGTADMKAGVAAMVFAVKAIQAAGVQLDGDLILQSVLEEECTGNGTLACLARGYRADAALIPEPFNLAAVAAQVGVMWLRVRVIGRGAHVMGAHAAVNAVDKSYVLIQALRELEAEVNTSVAHPLYKDVVHPLNYNIGVIRGGDWPSTVPAECVFEARVSALPGQKLEAVKARITERLTAAAAADPYLRDVPAELTFYGFHAEPMAIDPNQPAFVPLAAAHRQVTGQDLTWFASTATTDARFFNLYFGIPATCYGPVGEGLHAPDEHVEVESIFTIAKVLARYVLAWCGVARG